MEQIVELDEKDDITSIRSRIDFALLSSSEAGSNAGSTRVNRLLLVVPRKNKALQSLVQMKLLARAVRSRAVELAIVSDQPTVRDYAREAGVKAFGSLTAAKLAGWVKGQPPVAPPETTLPPVVPVPGESSPVAAPGLPARLLGFFKRERPAGRERVKPKKYVVVRGSGRVGCLQQVGALLILPVLAFALVVGVVALLPEATVTLTPIARPVQTELVVKADSTAKSVDFQTLTFPARQAQVELVVPGEIETVETEDAPVGLAEGLVTFINRTDVEQIIPISTTLAASAGQQVEFLTTITAAIPAAVNGTVSVPVIAAEPGPAGNVGSGQINRFINASYNLLARVVNEQGLSGGRMEPAKVVVQDDKERLAAYLRQKVQQEGFEQLQATLGEQEFVPLQSLQVIVLDISYKEFAGDFSDTFSGEMQAVVRGIVVGGYNANRLALAALERQVPPGYTLDPGGLKFGAGEVTDVNEQSATFTIYASGLATPVIDPHKVAEEVAWLPLGDAQAILSQQYELATVPGIDLKPDWLVNELGRLPYSPLRIRVVIRDAVALMAEED